VLGLRAIKIIAIAQLFSTSQRWHHVPPERCCFVWPRAPAVLLCGVLLTAAKSTLKKQFTAFGQVKASKTPKMRQ
jgi:hypothetical protein